MLFEKLKNRWGLDDPWQVIIVLVVFAVTGMSVLYVRKFGFYLFGITDATPGWLKTIAWLLIVLPTYQVLLLMFGFVFGQFDFFWEFEKRSLQKLKRLFKKLNSSA